VQKQKLREQDAAKDIMPATTKKATRTRTRRSNKSGAPPGGSSDRCPSITIEQVQWEFELSPEIGFPRRDEERDAGGWTKFDRDLLCGHSTSPTHMRKCLYGTGTQGGVNGYMNTPFGGCLALDLGQSNKDG